MVIGGLPVMGIARSCVAGFVVGAALLLPATTAGATPAVESQEGGDSEYVVAFEPSDQVEAVAAIAEAGGTVVDVNETIGLALVETGNADFVATVRADDAVTGTTRNNSIGATRPGMPHRFVEERPSVAERAAHSGRRGGDHRGRGNNVEPLADQQWDMAAIGATRDGAWRRATGRGVQVGIIDTGIDGSHPDLAPNFNGRLSRNFTTDIPEIDGPCEVASCVDPANVDDGGHGTHVAGTGAAARNGIGIAGVAPDAELVNLRAGQDSGYFFLYETVAALTYAGDIRLDVVNMSFYTDPWLYYCDSPDDYIEGSVTPEQLDEQAFAREQISAALEYAHARGVTLVSSAGNGHTDLSAPTRFDASSPDYGAPAMARTVTNDCLDLPSEGPHTIAVGATGPSGTKSDYSNYGLGSVDLAAPGGWYRDGVGTDTFQTPANLVLSSYPLHVAIANGLADANGEPVDEFSMVSCDRRGNNCGFYTYLQGTSMASPHVTGVAALVIDARSHSTRHASLHPDKVRSVLLRTATDHACPAAGFEDYSDEGRDPAAYNAACVGSAANNSLWGEGIVNATAAVSSRR
jgi:subtilisin family serine protease